MIGKIDFEKKKMDIDEIKEIDKGDTFYAPQFISEEDKPIYGRLAWVCGENDILHMSGIMAM